ncbi:efflux RND transporter permease subunit [Rhabdothermincola salaria]|uniref:efflux RND transporter permease subunit n=1 Tax=Rhabdothermincola salaria TaxID=2903142 RepID=UPI001E5F1834|nr:MMPL family transporter [Rhabdothermincola salaria]MCD9624992.1 MMPL family transporter [Rhabdothermincola salaria]
MDAWHDMMQRLWARIGRFLVAHAGAVLIVTLLISVVLAFGATRLTFATGQDSYLNADSQVAIDNRAYQDLFGGEAMITAIAMEDGGSIVDLFTAENNAEMRRIQEEVKALPGVNGAVTPLTALEWSQNLVVAPEGSDDPTASVAGGILLGATGRETDPDAQAARLADAATTVERLEAAGEQRLDNPEWVRFLLIDNQGDIRASLRPFFPVAPGQEPTEANAIQAQMLTRLTGNASIEEEGEAATEVVEIVETAELSGARTLTTGGPVLLKDINDYLQGGMLVLGAIAVVVMIVVLSLAFRVRWRLVPLLVMAIGVVWTFGLLGYTGFQLSLVTIAGLPILIGLGVEFAIQVHNRVEEELLLERASTPFVESIRNIGPALAVATVAAAIACLALLASKVPMIREFGILLAIGIVLVFAAAIVVPVATLSIRERRSPTTERRQQRVVERSMVQLARAPKVLVGPLVFAAVALFAVGMVVEEDTPIQTDPEKWVDQDSQTIKDLDQLKAETGSSSELGVYIQSPDGVLTDEMSAFVTGLALDTLEGNADTLVNVSSLATTVFYLMEVPGASPLPPTGEDLQNAYAVAPPDIQQSLVADDGNATNMVFLVGQSSLEIRKDLVDELRATVQPPAGATATPAGLAVVGVGLLDNLTANRLLLTWLALGGVALWLVIRFASLVKAALVLLPVLLAVGLAATVVWAAGITVSPLTTVSGPLVIAICTEFATLILFRHLEERRAGHAPRTAVDIAAARTGRAFFASSLTIVGGFAVLLVSPLPLLRDFGAIVALTVAIALLSAVTVLPPVLIWADERGWVKAGRSTATDPTGADRRSTEAPV